jgi:hypothetical protein
MREEREKREWIRKRLQTIANLKIKKIKIKKKTHIATGAGKVRRSRAGLNLQGKSKNSSHQKKREHSKQEHSRD